MKLHLDQIRESPKDLAYVESVDELNARLHAGSGDFRVEPGMPVDLRHYRAGLDVVVEGRLHGSVHGTCARCLDDYTFPLDLPFRVVLTPRVAASEGGELDEEDLGIGFYEGEEIDVTALVHEQAILALPTRALCREECLGLCSRCGANLNGGPCGCSVAVEDPRLAPLRALARRT
jgi:uncharacterized protein